MKELAFRTNIKNSSQIKLITDKLNSSLGLRPWSFDLEDEYKIFKVEVLYTTPIEIIELFESMGYSCEFLHQNTTNI